MIKTYYLYILSCENGSYYTGYTVNLEQRYRKHLRGEVKYTRAFKPLAIACSWLVRAEVGTVLKLERLVKKLSHRQKEQLVHSPAAITTLASEQLNTVPEIEIHKTSFSPVKNQ